MNRSVRLLVGILFLIVAAVVYFRSGHETTLQEAKAPAASQPLYDWVNIFEKQVKINNGGIVTVRIHNAPKVRISMNANHPVRMAMVEGRVDRNLLDAIDSGQASCSEAQATSVARECEVPNGAANLLLLYKDGPEPEQMLNLKVEAWQCTAGCK